MKALGLTLALIIAGFSGAGAEPESFDVGEHKAYLEVAPRPAEGKPWIWYAPNVKGDFILLGQSRGGIMTLAWAVRHPDKVTAWAGIYPVCSLTSYPLRFSKEQTLADFGMDEATIRAKLDELNPVENLAGLAKNKVPLFSVHGDKDGTVPYDENTKLLKERYEAAGGTCEAKIIPGRGHEVYPEFFQCQELVDSVLQQVGKKKTDIP